MQKTKIAIIVTMALVVVCCGVGIKNAMTTKENSAGVSTTSECVEETCSTTAVCVETANFEECSTEITTVVSKNSVNETLVSRVSVTSKTTDVSTVEKPESTMVTKAAVTKPSSATASTTTKIKEIEPVSAVVSSKPSSDSICDQHRPNDAVKELEPGVWLCSSGRIVVFVENGYVITYSNEANYMRRISAALNYTCPYCHGFDCKGITKTYSYNGVLLKAYCEYPQYCEAVQEDGTTGEICSACKKPFMISSYYVAANYPPVYCDGTCTWTRK
jgi:hypothetical protein